MNQSPHQPAPATKALRTGTSILATFLALLLWSGVQAQSVTDSPAPQPAAGATWYVDAAMPASGDGRTAETAVKTISEGLALAAAGDTVLVAAGLYTDTQTVAVPAEVRLMGAGMGESIIEGAPAADPIVQLDYGSRLEGFTVRSGDDEATGRGIAVRDGGAAVIGNCIENTAVGIQAKFEEFARDYDAPMEIAYNVVADSRLLGISIDGGMAGAISHNTVAGRALGVWVGPKDVMIEGNLVMGQPPIDCPNGPAMKYNNFFRTTVDAADANWCIGDGTNFNLDPFVRDRANGDFRLSAGSPMRGRGPDGSDIGALPFAAADMPPTITMTPLNLREVRVDWSNTGAAIYDLFVGVSPEESPYENVDFRYKDRIVITDTFSVVFTRSNPLTYPIIAVSAVSAAGDVTNLAVAPQPPPTVLPNGTVEQDHPLIWPDGNWKTIADPQASGGSYIANNSNGRLFIPFMGDTLVLGRKVGPAGGGAYLEVDDGGDYGEISFQFTTDRWQVPAYLSGFGPGPHLLTLHLNYSATDANVDFITTPSSIQPSPEQMQAAERVNFHRELAGLRPARGDLALNLAAQSHADFVARNRKDSRLAGLGFHLELPDMPGFTGALPWDRAQYFGYGGIAGEDGGLYGDPIRSVDEWMATVYHRNLIMCYTCTDMGYGMVNDSAAKVDSLSMAPASGLPDERRIYTYPAVNQTNVPTEWRGGEAPNPLPGVQYPVGYPISLYLAQPDDESLAAADAGAWMTGAVAAPHSPQWSVTAAELRTADGADIPIYMLDQNTDKPKYLGPDVVFLIAHRPLAKDTTYYAHIAGTDSRGAPFDYRWSFSTGGALAAPDLAGSATWSEPLMPQAEGTITYRVRLVNTGLGAEGVTVHATLPEASTYVAGSASTSQGSVSGAGPLDFAIGALPKGGSAEIRYSVKLMAGIDMPRLMSSDVTVAWSAGQIFRRISAFAGAKEPLFLPAVVR